MALNTHLCIIYINIFVFCYCYIQNLYAASITPNLDTHKQFLILIKSETITQPPDALATWDENVSPCNWTRVSCDDSGQRIIGLDLSRLQIIGQVSTHIGNLTFLTSLQLQDNLFDTILSETITNLLHLQVFNISNNNIRGAIPTNISRCINLRIVDFMQNKLSGSIPQDLTLLMNLTTLNLAKNYLSGSIPPSIANLSSLSTLNLGTNSFTGRVPGDLSRLLSLKNLDLSINNLTGIFPLSIYNMSLLESLLVSSNNFVGDIPNNVGDTLPNLLVFCFCMNRFTGTFPGSLHNLTNIKIIRLAYNRLHGTLPQGLGNLHELQTYNIRHNNIVDSLGFLDSLVNNTKLDFLAIDGNHFDGVIPESIGNLSNQLRILYMGSNQISGGIPVSISQLKSLALLDVSHNLISGEIPSEIGQLNNLQELILGKNRLTSKIPNSLGNLSKLTQIDLSNNELGGSIPMSFTRLERLIFMDLSMNKLSGSIPREIFDLSSLTSIFNLSSNLLTGLLPQEIENLKTVVAIDLSNNHLSGNIPSSIQYCKSLEHLIISRNYFSGSIPNSLGELKGLETLDLSSNQLSGLVPNKLQNLNALRFLNLSYNNLEGKVPFFSNHTSVHLQGNPKLCIKCDITQNYKKTVVMISLAVIIFVSAIIFILIAWSNFYFHKHNDDGIVMVMDIPDSFKGQYQMVTYKDLCSATMNFNEKNLIGRGSFGSVYHGRCLNLQGQQIHEVAVKVFDVDTRSSFISECETLRHLRHRNIIKLITSCSSLDKKNNIFLSLVYEFIKNGDLESWIGSGRMGLLDGLNVAIDVASGLSYLHHECAVAPVVHCDLKPSNVLLDQDFTAKIGDFGLATMLGEKRKSFSATRLLRGSMGFIPPEYGMGAKPSTNGDVYSYGIMLMVIFTGKRPTDESFVDGLRLNTWVHAAFPAKLDQVLDPNMLKEPNGQSMSIKLLLDGLTKIIGVALSCTNDDPEGRITISEALRQLKSVQDMFHKSNPLKVVC